MRTDQKGVPMRCTCLRIVFVAMILSSANAAVACLACYRSPDWLTSNSPLVFVGEVLDVKELPAPEGNQSKRPGRSPSKASIATVRVLRVLKGTWKAETMDVHSGPLGSCNPFEEAHYTFTKGDKSIFILPCKPSGGTARLQHAGSLLGLEDMELVESCLNRAIVHQAEYLRDIRRDQPETYQAAAALLQAIRADSDKWLADLTLTTERAIELATARREEDAWQQKVQAAGQALAKELSKHKVETVRTALALAWLDDSNIWWSHPVWGQANGKYSSSRHTELIQSRKSYYAGVLARAGVEKKYIQEYLKDAEDSAIRSSVDFPVLGPSFARKEHSSDWETTEFILASSLFHRGMMFVHYGMRFDHLRKLNAKRLADVVPALCNSLDQRLSLVGYRAIERLPGDIFVKFIFGNMLDKSPSQWRYLIDDKDARITADRLKALARVGKEYGPFAESMFWSALTTSGCDEPALIEEAIASLREREAAKEKVQEKDFAAGSIRRFLDRNMQDRTDQDKDARMTAAQYETWFKKHPVKENSTAPLIP